jgi:hypothetical protein
LFLNYLKDVHGNISEVVGKTHFLQLYIRSSMYLVIIEKCVNIVELCMYKYCISLIWFITEHLISASNVAFGPLSLCRDVSSVENCCQLSIILLNTGKLLGSFLQTFFHLTSEPVYILLRQIDIGSHVWRSISYYHHLPLMTIEHGEKRPYICIYQYGI